MPRISRHDPTVHGASSATVDAASLPKYNDDPSPELHINKHDSSSSAASATGSSSSSSSTAYLSADLGSGPPPAPSQGQGWVQWTDRGKMYLSRHEKNVFVLEGTTTAGFAACKYTGNEKETTLLGSGEWSLVCELKAAGMIGGGVEGTGTTNSRGGEGASSRGGGMEEGSSSSSTGSAVGGATSSSSSSGAGAISHPQGDIYVLVDAVEASDLSSGCDFLAIKLSFSSRELRVENRRRTNVQTLFSIPNVLMLRGGK